MKWEKAWFSQHTPWDRGDVHPLFLEIKKQFPQCFQGKALVPGCGHGHEAGWASSVGLEEVVGVDIVETAIESAKKRYSQGVDFFVKDFLKQDPKWIDGFDVVLDRACLCAFPEIDRRAYYERIGQYIKEGGFWVSVSFEQVSRKDGPPFAVPMQEIHSYLDKNFSLMYARHSRQYCQDPIENECLQVWKKSSPLL